MGGCACARVMVRFVPVRVRERVGVFASIRCGDGTAFYRAVLTYILNEAFARYVSCDWARSSKPSPASSPCPRRVRIVRVRVSVCGLI